jgi:hypothetical protein
MENIMFFSRLYGLDKLTIAKRAQGLMIQGFWIRDDDTTHGKLARYRPHGPAGPLMLQDHGRPVRYRNIENTANNPKAKPMDTVTEFSNAVTRNTPTPNRMNEAAFSRWWENA